MTPAETIAAVDALRPELIELRRYFHANPEPSLAEYETAAFAADRLRALGYQVRTGVGGTGVVATLAADRPGPRLLLRADADALPIAEQNDVPYRSRREGVMHACGHDAHLAIALGVARQMAAWRDRWRGTLVVLIQPAEEVFGGAAPMIADGALEPRPDLVLGLHVWNNLPVGTVGVRSGALFANADEFAIEVRGRGGHGAMPHQAVDPIVAAAQIVTALQTLVSREVAPLETAVVSVGRIEGGSAFNIIPAAVRLAGTVRTFDEALQSRLRERIGALAEGVAAAFRCTVDYRYTVGCPAVVNDPDATELVRRAAAEVLRPEAVIESEPTTGGDDMSLFLRAAPGCYFFVGSANPARGLSSPHHSPTFDIDEEALVVGARVLLQAAMRYLGDDPAAT